jgi:hypothetical protein
MKVASRKLNQMNTLVNVLTVLRALTAKKVIFIYFFLISLKEVFKILHCIGIFSIEINACLSAPCLNNATCYKKPAGIYYCECIPGFHGLNCEQDVNMCELAYCKNNAKCIDGIGANYTCLCSVGYTGQFCEIDINECEKNPCLNDGQCSEAGPGEYNCECGENFTGQNCETSK